MVYRDARRQQSEARRVGEVSPKKGLEGEGKERDDDRFYVSSSSEEEEEDDFSDVGEILSHAPCDLSHCKSASLYLSSLSLFSTFLPRSFIRHVKRQPSRLHFIARLVGNSGEKRWNSIKQGKISTLFFNDFEVYRVILLELSRGFMPSSHAQ